MTLLNGSDVEDYLQATFGDSLTVVSVAGLPQSKNSCFRVDTIEQGPLFLKTSSVPRQQRDGVLLSEGLIFSEFQGSGRPPELRLPRLLFHDRRSDVLIFQWMDGNQASASFKEEYCSKLGTYLATYHGWAAEHLLDRSNPVGTTCVDLVPRTDPVTLDEYVRLSAAEVRLISMLSTRESIRRVLNAIRVLEPNTIVHGDLRSANIMMDGSGTIAALDWEQCQPGRAEFDVGTVYGDCIDELLYEQTSVAVLLRETCRNLEPFMQAYLQVPSNSISLSGGLIAQFTGVHLLHRVAAQFRTAGLPHPTDKLRLTLAVELITDGSLVPHLLQPGSVVAT